MTIGQADVKPHVTCKPSSMHNDTQLGGGGGERKNRIDKEKDPSIGSLR